MTSSPHGDGNSTVIMEKTPQTPEEEKLKRAKKRVEEIKGFYIHAAVYLVVNAFILVNLALNNLGNDGNFWSFPSFLTPFFWGIGLAFHALNTFKKDRLFGKKWEEKMIQKYIEKDKQEAEKYK